MVESSGQTLAGSIYHPDTSAFIEFEHVAVRLGGRKVLTDIDWRIERGQNWALWGGNGAGKSTLARALLGEAAVVAGFIRRGDDTRPRSGRARPAVALVSSDQYHRFYEQERMLEEMRGFSGRGRETRVGDLTLPEGGAEHEQRRRWIETLLGLTPVLSKPLLSLSSGEMRKLLLGRALLQHPRMLVLDEPFNGLDAENRRSLKLALAQMCAGGETQLVLITHRLSEIPEGFGHILHLEQGRVVWQGARTAFPAHLDHQEAQRRKPAGAWSAPDAAPPCGAPLVRMHAASVRFGRRPVLEDVDWAVNAGEQWAVIGPNGAGKTTLLKLITGEQLQAYANRIELFGRQKGSGEAVQELKDRIGHMDDVLQARYQLDMTGLDVVCSGFFDSLGLYRRCTPEQIETARQWLSRLDLESLAALRFARLSFGQQRLLLIARAMVKSPSLLILDEPCNGLDAKNRRRLLALLDRIAGQGTASLIYTSHRPDEMPDCITHRLYLENGRVVRTARRLDL